MEKSSERVGSIESFNHLYAHKHTNKAIAEGSYRIIDIIGRDWERLS